jgi:dTDP-4-dehydrorhamnose 3,5-epimerase
MNPHPQWRFTPLPLQGAALIEPSVHQDNRGSFVKTFHAANLAVHGRFFNLREEFFSVSRRGVLRGMHFQTPPFDHQKLVTCITGRVLDVLLDLRRGSPTFGASCGIELKGSSPQVVWLPRGFAHGFLSLEENSCVAYKTDVEYAPQHDSGIRWSSFGFKWPLTADEVIVSLRDSQHLPLKDFDSPFVYECGAAA